MYTGKKIGTAPLNFGTVPKLIRHGTPRLHEPKYKIFFNKSAPYLFCIGTHTTHQFCEKMIGKKCSLSFYRLLIRNNRLGDKKEAPERYREEVERQRKDFPENCKQFVSL